ncbi:MAG: right-handed parallel beta-helix repeat-containing protein [Planctomycetes bacterium]|nr:right-handed parallel beta-helix repeat-containing protein [Planctomycetota bacterium]
MAWTRWIFALLFLAAAGAAHAQTTFNVTSNADSGAGSLRDAITQANASTSTADTITFGITGTITLTTALPVITDNLTIDGPGRTALTIERDNLAADFRIFETNTIGLTLNINELTIQGGRATQGAGILSRGPLGLYDVLIQDCIAQGATAGGNGEGGAIYHTPAVALCALTNCLIQNCQAIGGDNASGTAGAGFGGAIYINAGTLGLLSTTINNCDAIGGDSTGGNGDGGEAWGGAVYAKFAAGFTDSVISNCDTAVGAPNGSGTSPGGSGGAVYGEGAITSIDTTWQNNTLTTGGQALGGAICFSPSSTQQLTVTRSVFAGNDATAGGTNGNSLGSTIASFGIFEIRETEISGSVATPTGTGIGVVVYHEASAALLMERSTVAGNTGDAVHIEISSSADIVNSTISGNTSASNAGGVTTLGAAVDITFCTITLNTGATGGGIATAGSGTITVTGSIIAGNTGGSAANADYALSGGSIFDAGGNVIGVEDGSTFTNIATQKGTSSAALNAMLSALADNGGLTRTHALASGSPAVDMGGSTGVPSTDQRNAPRNVGAADAGAYEFGATVPSGQGSAGGEGDSRCAVSADGGAGWLLLLGLLGAIGLTTRLRRAN